MEICKRELEFYLNASDRKKVYYLKCLFFVTGELYVMVEYCHIGNLRNYLLRNKDYFVDTMEDELEPGMEKKRLSDFASSKPHYVNKAQPESTAELNRPLTTKTLICYAYQVARGMEYLACKKVGILSLMSSFPTTKLNHSSFIGSCII